MKKSKIQEELSHIHDICRDAYMGYQKASLCLKGSDLGGFYQMLAYQRGAFLEEICQEAQYLSIDLEQTALGKKVGYFEHLWVNASQLFHHRSQPEILDETYQGEKIALDAYQGLLGQHEILSTTRSKLLYQQHRVREVMRYLGKFQKAF